MNPEHRAVECRSDGPGYRVGLRRVLPRDEADRLIAAGHAAGLTLVRFKSTVGPYAPGETAGFFDHVAQRLVELDLAEVIPVQPPADNQGAETTVTKEVKP
jgi:hypothetical protein